MTNATEQQRSYYERTAEHYDAMHVSPTDEHGISLAAFMGLVDLFGPPKSILDIGAGTGRAIQKLKGKFPAARIVGIEPVAALRAVGHMNGISHDELINGNALNLQFSDNSFDWVTETGVLHHIPTPLQAVKEMVRVARVGVLISDCNNIGQGSPLVRAIKLSLKNLGLWKYFVWLQTSGRMYKISEGDGVFYSFCAFDCIATLNEKFPVRRFMNTVPCDTPNLFGSASHVMIIASKH